MRKLLSLTFTLLIALSALNSFSATYSSAFTMAVGASEAITSSSTIVSMTSSNTSVLQITYPGEGTTTGYVYGASVGTAVVTVVAINPTDGYSYDYYSILVTVGASGTTTASNSSNVALTVGQAINQQHSSIYNVVSSNSSVAVAYASGTTLTITGISAGSATITFNSYDYYGNYSTSTIYVTVSAASSLNTTTNANVTTGQPIAITAGKTYSTASAFFNITNLTVDDPTIASASATTTGKVAITGISQGTTNVRFSYMPSSYSVASSAIVTVNVASDTSFSSSSSSTQAAQSAQTALNELVLKSSGISNIAKGKKYKLSSITLNGDKVAASELLWMSADSDMLQVDKYSGIYSGLSSGTTKLIAVDYDGKYVSSITVQIN